MFGIEKDFQQLMEQVYGPLGEKQQMTEIEEVKAQIKVLEKKLSFLEELEKTKSPVREAFKDWMGVYPPTNPSVDNIFDIRWRAFQKGYNAAYEEKVVEEEPEEQKWDAVRESVKWCEEHPDEDPLDYVKPQTPEETERGMRQQTEKWKEIQKLIDEEDNDKNFKNSLDLIKEWGEKNKPPTLYQLIEDWWSDIFCANSTDDMETCIDGLVDKIDKEFIPPSSEKNGYEWEKCLKIMRDKLR